MKSLTPLLASKNSAFCDAIPVESEFVCVQGNYVIFYVRMPGCPEASGGGGGCVIEMGRASLFSAQKHNNSTGMHYITRYTVLCSKLVPAFPSIF